MGPRRGADVGVGVDGELVASLALLARALGGKAAAETRVVEALARAALEASRAEGEAGGTRRRRLAGEEVRPALDLGSVATVVALAEDSVASAAADAASNSSASLSGGSSPGSVSPDAVAAVAAVVSGADAALRTAIAAASAGAASDPLAVASSAAAVSAVMQGDAMRDAVAEAAADPRTPSPRR